MTGKDFGNHGSLCHIRNQFPGRNGNGVRDGDETGQADGSIQLPKDGNVINATTTGQDGSYAFKNLAPGKYTVSEVARKAWTQPATRGLLHVELLDADVIGRDFGNSGGFTISGLKFYDINGNGVQDSDEPGIPGGACEPGRGR